MFTSTQQKPLFGTTTPTISTGGFGFAGGAGVGTTNTFQPANTSSTLAQPATSGGLFGSTTTATAAAGNSMATPSLFGGSSVQQPSASLFSQQQPQPTSSFSLSQQPQQQQQQQLFMQPQIQPQQQNAMQQYQTVQTMTTTAQELEELMSAFDPNDVRCKFRYAFYNLVDPSSVSRYAKPQNIPDALWNEAVANSPDPTCMVPVFASSFEDLQKRIHQQNTHTTEYQTKLKEISDSLDKVSQVEQVEIFSRLLKCQRKQIEATHKVLRIMKMVQVLRARGYPSLTREEELMRSRLESLNKSIQQQGIKSKTDDLASKVQNLKFSQPRKSKIDIFDQGAVETVGKTLGEMQKGFDKLTLLLKHDLEGVAVMEKGYKQKPGENSFRNSVY